MVNRLRFILRFIKRAFSAKGFNPDLSLQLNKIGKRCISHVKDMGREDLKTEHFESFVAHILGIFSTVISYHESISFLCLSKHGLNASVLLRSELEAYLIFSYFIAPTNDLQEVERRVEDYRDWVKVKMYLNSKKSKDFELFTLNPLHEPYLASVEQNYNQVKDKYANSPKQFQQIEQSQSFLKNKKQIAIECGIEELYQAVFSETSATVHMADISDRMIPELREDFDGYSYNFGLGNEEMMISGISNILLSAAIGDFMKFFDLPIHVREKLFRNVQLSARINED